MNFDKEKLGIIIIALKLYEIKQKEAIEVLRKIRNNPSSTKTLEVSKRILLLTQEMEIDIQNYLSKEGG